MSLFISQLLLPLNSATVQRNLLADPYQLHLMVMRGFPSPPGRVLFRLEPQTRKESTHATLLIQGTVRPNWKSAGLYEEVEASEIKVFEPKFRLGDRLRFRLRANPTVKKFVEGRKNGSRVSVTGEEGRLAWLKRKADQYGFKTDALGVVSVDEGTLIGKKGPLKMALQSVRYEGHLEVMNPEALAKALTEGIGPAKGLGFGLLSLAPA